MLLRLTFILASQVCWCVLGFGSLAAQETVWAGLGSSYFGVNFKTERHAENISSMGGVFAPDVELGAKPLNPFIVSLRWVHHFQDGIALPRRNFTHGLLGVGVELPVLTKNQAFKRQFFSAVLHLGKVRGFVDDSPPPTSWTYGIRLETSYVVKPWLAFSFGAFHLRYRDLRATTTIFHYWFYMTGVELKVKAHLPLGYGKK